MELEQTPVAKSEMLIRRPVAEASARRLSDAVRVSLPQRRKALPRFYGLI
jgi:hypothetical protein